MKNLCSYLFFFAAGAILLGTTGCFSGSSDMGQVSGVVTLGGEPLEGARVSFYPSGGRGSLGVTDETGRYELTYLRNEKGAVVGKHQVTISTFVQDEIDYRGDTAGESGDGGNHEKVTKGHPETLPEKYCDLKKTELTAMVEAGANELNFEL